jgi:hypothetical protein
MTLEDDARDLLIHSRIESALRILAGYHKRGRADGLSDLLKCAKRTGYAHLEHMIEAIMTGQDITREDLADRIQAFIEADEEELRERAIRAACEHDAEEAA